MTTTQTAAASEFVLSRVFDAPRDLVWKCFTDPEHMKHWAGPRQFEARDIENDPRTGGKWRLCLHTDGFDVGDGELKKFDLWQGGETLEVVEPERLVYTFKWDQNPGLSSNVETVITITLKEDDGKTTMDFRQAFFATAGDRDGHMRGWNSSFDKLQDYLGEVQTKESAHGKR